MVDPVEKQAVEMQQIKASLNEFAEKVAPLAKRMGQLEALCERNVAMLKDVQDVQTRFANAEKAMSRLLQEARGLPGEMKKHVPDLHSLNKMMDSLPLMQERLQQAEGDLKHLINRADHDQMSLNCCKENMEKVKIESRERLAAMDEKAKKLRTDIQEAHDRAAEQVKKEALLRDGLEKKQDDALAKLAHDVKKLQQKLESAAQEVLKVHHRMEDMKALNEKRDANYEKVFKELYEKVNPVQSLRLEVRALKAQLEEALKKKDA